MSNASLATSACAIKPAITGRLKVVSVNGVEIPRAAISQEAQNHPASKPIEAWQAAARALVVRELLFQEAQRRGIVPEPLEDAEGRRETDDEALIRMLIKSDIKVPEADDAACRRYFDMNRDRFRSADLYELRHILLPVVAGSTASLVEAQDNARAIIADVQRDPMMFERHARELSACPSGKVGGNLGQIGPGQTVPEFEEALSSLPVGEVAVNPVESRYGLHIVWIDRRVEGRELPFEAVRGSIAAWLGEKVHRTAIRQYLSILAGRAHITGIDILASSSPLVQ